MLTLVAKLAIALQEPLAYLSLCSYKRGSETDSNVRGKNVKPTVWSSVGEWTTFSSSTSASLEESTRDMAQGSYTVT